MKIYLNLCIAWMLNLITLTAIAQVAVAEKPSLDKGTIQEQFDFLIEESNKYQDYRVVKRTWLYKLKGHVADSLKVVNNELSATQQVVSKQKQEMERLQNELAKTNGDLGSIQKEKDSIQFFGMQTAKSTYKTIMWAIIGVLLASLLYFIFMFKRSNSITTNTQMALIKIQEEYESYKRRALEKEQKLKRELQDELNKQS